MTLNDYIQKYAKQGSHGDISQTHILFDEDADQIVSYFSMCNSEVLKESVSSSFGVPVKKVPAVLIGRLAVDKRFKGQGFGEYTLVSALKMIKTLSLISGIKIVIVDALNESAKAFYKSYGFKEFDDDKMRLFISIKAVNP